MSLLVSLATLLTLCQLITATSIEGCSSCGAVPITKIIVGRGGNITQFEDFEYSYESGCGKAIGWCTAPVGHSGGLVLQLNNDHTKLSTFEPIKLVCNDNGQWIYAKKYKKVIVENVTCIVA